MSKIIVKVWHEFDKQAEVDMFMDFLQEEGQKAEVIHE